MPVLAIALCMEPGSPLSAPLGASSQISPDGGTGGTLPDVVIETDGGCHVSAERLDIIKERARKLLHDSYRAGFEHFPIDRNDFISKTLPLIDEDAVCHALVTPSGANEKNHNSLRREYSGGTLSKNDAGGRGVFASKVPVKTSCPSGYDWKNSFFYTNVESCEDVTKNIPKNGIPTFMYSVQMPARTAAVHLKDAGSMGFYSRYAGAGPTLCESGQNYTDAYHEIRLSAFLPNLKFAMRGIHGKNFAAWEHLRSCKSGTQNLGASDLMFNFGARVFIPLDVEDGSGRYERTFIMTQSAAVSNSSLSRFFSEDFKFESVIGREFAKKLFLEAKAKGWKVER